MGYSFRIGKAIISFYENEPYPSVMPCEGGKEVWDDDMGADGPCRSPSYSQWHDLLQKAPLFEDFWNRLIKKAQDCEAWIPISCYVNDLPALEAYAATVERNIAVRIYWFVKWSQHARKLYGNLAVFEKPGEWKCN